MATIPKTRCDDCLYAGDVKCLIDSSYFRQQVAENCQFFQMKPQTIHIDPSTGKVIFKEKEMGHKIKCVSCKHDTVTGCLKKMPSWNTKKSRNCNAYELMTGTTVNTPPTTTKHRQNGKASYCESETGVSLFYP